MSAGAWPQWCSSRTGPHASADRCTTQRVVLQQQWALRGSGWVLPSPAPTKSVGQRQDGVCPSCNQLLTRCVKFWMYMLKSMGEFREATMAVRLYGLLLSLCAEITAVICERRKDGDRGALHQREPRKHKTSPLMFRSGNSRCLLLGTAWWGGLGSRWPWSERQGAAEC
jgi:hypothetical protein